MPDAFARPDEAEGRLWIETPHTATAMAALFALLDVSRQDEPGWHPHYVLCGPEGTGKSALAERFVAQAHRSLACDALRDVAELRTPRVPSPEAFARRDEAWSRYRAFQDMSLQERVSRFGSCPTICRPAEFMPEAAFRAALHGIDQEQPAGMGELHPGRPLTDAVAGGIWGTPGNRTNDGLRRTGVFIIDDADHLKRLNPNRRGEALAQLRDWPRAIGLGHRPIMVLVGTPALADAVAECGEVRRITLPAMAPDGPDGTFGLVCKRIFGPLDPADVERLHAATKGAMGALLTIARLQGLRPPFAIPDDEILRLPAPDKD